MPVIPHKDIPQKDIRECPVCGKIRSKAGWNKIRTRVQRRLYTCTNKECSNYDRRVMAVKKEYQDMIEERPY